jgi:CelD/BcsL family acetyltransferase involved in cellulose biosynthesis
MTESILNPAAISFEVYNSIEELSQIQNEWDRLVMETGGGIYLTYDWCRIWWRYYGGNRTSLIFIFRDGNGLTGLAPMFIERLGTRFFNILVCKTIGSDYTLNLCNPAIRSACADFVYEKVLEYLFENKKCDMVIFGPALETDAYPREILARAISNRTTMEKTDSGVNTHYRLPDSFDQYLAQLSKSERKHYKRNVERLSSQYHFSYDCICAGDELEAAFEDFMRVHRDQWRRVGKLGHFDDWPESENFHREMVREQSTKNRLRLFRLTAGGENIAYRYVYYFGGDYYSYLPARFSGQPWDNYGLGQMTHVFTVKHAIEEDVKYIDAGRGMYDHKIHLGGQTTNICTMRIVSNKLPSRVKTFIAVIFSKIIHFWYYRIWFNRISPKLSFKRHPLWKIWIQTRI